MKITLTPLLLLTIVSISTFHSLAQGQVTDTVSSSRSDAKTPEVAQAEARDNKLTGDAGRYFKTGSAQYAGQSPSASRRRF